MSSKFFVSDNWRKKLLKDGVVLVFLRICFSAYLFDSKFDRIKPTNSNQNKFTTVKKMPKNRYCAIQNCVHNKGTSDASVRMFRYIEYQLLNLISQ